MPCPPFSWPDLPLFVFIPSEQHMRREGGQECAAEILLLLLGSWIQMWKGRSRAEKENRSRKIGNTKPDLNTKGIEIPLFRYNFCPKGAKGAPAQISSARGGVHRAVLTRVRRSADHEGEFSSQFLVVPKSTALVGILVSPGRAEMILPKKEQPRVISSSSHNSGFLS